MVVDEVIENWRCGCFYEGGGGGDLLVLGGLVLCECVVDGE